MKKFLFGMFLFFILSSNLEAARVLGPMEILYSPAGAIIHVRINVAFDPHAPEAVFLVPGEVTFTLAGNGDFTVATKTAILSAFRAKVIARQAALNAERSARDAAAAADAGRRALIVLNVRDQDIN